MSAKDLAAMSVEMGTTIRKAAKDYGIPSSTLYSHMLRYKVKSKIHYIHNTVRGELLHPCTKKCLVH